MLELLLSLDETYLDKIKGDDEAEAVAGLITTLLKHSSVGPTTIKTIKFTPAGIQLMERLGQDDKFDSVDAYEPNLMALMHTVGTGRSNLWPDIKAYTEVAAPRKNQR